MYVLHVCYLWYLLCYFLLVTELGLLLLLVLCYYLCYGITCIMILLVLCYSLYYGIACIMLLLVGKKRIDVDTVDESYQLDMNSPVAPQPLVAAAWEQSNYDVIDQLLSFDADVCNSYTSLPETNKPKPLFYQVNIYNILAPV